MPVASQESCAALELYHNQLKIRLLNEKDPEIYRRADWLVDKLGTKVQAYFWLDEYSGRDDFSRYWKDEWASGLTAWRKSLTILDTDVVRQGRCMKVIDQHDRDVSHVVWNPGTEYAICDCSWAEKGNLCEHVFKIIKLFRDKGFVLPSISVTQYNQSLIKMLHCPPHDSFIRDHAVALAVWVHEQLSAQIDKQNSQEVTNPIEQQTEVGKEKHYRNEFTISHPENCPEVGHETSGCLNGDLGGQLVDQVARQISTPVEQDGVQSSCVEMEVDSLIISNPVPELVCIDESPTRNVSTENGGRSLIIDADPDISKGSSSADDGCKDYGSEDNDRNGNTADILLSETHSLKQCVNTNQSGVCGNVTEEPVTKRCRLSDDIETDTTLPSISSDSRMVEAADVVVEGRSTNPNPSVTTKLGNSLSSVSSDSQKTGDSEVILEKGNSDQTVSIASDSTLPQSTETSDVIVMNPNSDPSICIDSADAQIIQASDTVAENGSSSPVKENRSTEETLFPSTVTLSC